MFCGCNKTEIMYI